MLQSAYVLNVGSILSAVFAYMTLPTLNYGHQSHPPVCPNTKLEEAMKDEHGKLTVLSDLRSNCCRGTRERNADMGC
jgi:hypothetical protein